jgi:RNA polymerase sigma factor (TIGR02999 family)
MLVVMSPNKPESADETTAPDLPLPDLIQALAAAARNDEARWTALQALYPELRKIAASEMLNQSSGQTLQVTALVHEAALRLFGNDSEWETPRHFFAFVAVMMRRIIIDHARRRRRRLQLPNDSVLDQDTDRLEQAIDEDLGALASALEKLRTFDPVGADLVDLRFFAGYSVSAAVKALGLSERTADRKWARVRAWLKQELQGDS